MAGDTSVVSDQMNGLRMAEQLRKALAGALPPALLGPGAPVGALLESISAVFSRTVEALQRSESASVVTDPATPASSPPRAKKRRHRDADSPRAPNSNYRRRRAPPGELTVTRVVRQASEDDGYSWRKYGQKNIDGTKHPRCYYRCTYKTYSNCPAARQVQRADDDPSVFEITYFDEHCCAQRPPRAAAPEESGGYVIDFEAHARAMRLTPPGSDRERGSAVPEKAAASAPASSSSAPSPALDCPWFEDDCPDMFRNEELLMSVLGDAKEEDDLVDLPFWQPATFRLSSEPFAFPSLFSFNPACSGDAAGLLQSYSVM